MHPLVVGIIQGLKGLPKAAKDIPRAPTLPKSMVRIREVDVREDQELQEVRCKDCGCLNESRFCAFIGAQLSEDAVNELWQCEGFQPKERLGERRARSRSFFQLQA